MYLCEVYLQLIVLCDCVLAFSHCRFEERIQKKPPDNRHKHLRSWREWAGYSALWRLRWVEPRFRWGSLLACSGPIPHSLVPLHQGCLGIEGSPDRVSGTVGKAVSRGSQNDWGQFLSIGGSWGKGDSGCWLPGDVDPPRPRLCMWRWTAVSVNRGAGGDRKSRICKHLCFCLF